MATELNEKQPLIKQNKGRERDQGIRGNGGQGAAGFGRGSNKDAESDLSENGSRVSSIKSGKSDCPSVEDLNAEMQDGPEPRGPYLEPNERLHGPERRDQPNLEDERQNQNQEPPPQPVRHNEVKLIKDNVEIMYPFKQGCCLHCCTKKLSNNRKKCSAVAFFFAILFLAGSIACLVLIAKYPEVLTDTNDDITLYIPPKSAVKFNLMDYNISTIKRDQLTVAAASNAEKEHKGLIMIAATHNRKECTDADRLTTKMTYKYNKTEEKSFLRYWPSSSDVSVNISIHHNDSDHDHHITAWKWGTLNNPPPDVNCDASSMDGRIKDKNIDKGTFFNKKPKNNNVIRITFCNRNHNITTTATVEIQECVALPNKALYRYIYIDDSITEEPNPVEVEFKSFFSEMLKHSMLYIDTRHMSSSNKEADNEIQLKLQTQTSSNPLKEIVTAITIILFIASILFFSLGCCCLCCCRRIEFCGFGVYYNKRV